MLSPRNTIRLAFGTVGEPGAPGSCRIKNPKTSVTRKRFVMMISVRSGSEFSSLHELRPGLGQLLWTSDSQHHLRLVGDAGRRSSRGMASHQLRFQPGWHCGPLSGAISVRVLPALHPFL